MILANGSVICLSVEPKFDSGTVDIPAPILSSMSFRRTLGTLSSVARIVSRTIWKKRVSYRHNIYRGAT